MPPERDPVHVWDMLKAAEGIIASVNHLSLQEYLKDENLCLAVERRIEIIGEAARRISGSFKEAHPEIPWRLIIDQRNFLIHEYDEIDHQRLWRLAISDIPRLIEQLKPLIPPMPSGEDE